MKYLVTGGAGFIGTNLVNRLIERDHYVCVIDNLITGSRENFNPRAWYDVMDIEDFEIGDVFHTFDRIINLACPASPVAYQNAALQTISASTAGLMNLLEVAKWLGCRIQHTSTSEVYGDPDEHPQTEQYRGNVNCFGIRACYDEGKRLAETLMWEYHRIHYVDTRIVRIFNTYGPFMAQNDGRVVSNFIVQALKGEPITIYGDGMQTRSFCYIDDLLDVLLFNLEGNYECPVNVGNPTEFTMLELAETVLTVTGSKSTIEFKPLPHDDPRQRRPDISLAKELYGWEPKVDLRDGIARTVEYFKTVTN